MKEKFNWKKWLKWILVIVITVIAGYGLVIAPSKASDHLADNLKQEFAQNKKMLKEQEKSRKKSSDAKEASSEETSKKEDAKSKPADTRVTMVGDSVMLGAVPSLMEELPDSIIDAQESRQVVEAMDILKDLQSQDKLGGTVVIELGINSYFAESKGQEIIDYLGKDRKIYWVTVYGKYLQDQTKINDVIMDLAKQNDNVEVIRWDQEGEKHPEWFYNDGIHLNGEGRTGFAQVIHSALEGDTK